MPVSTHLPLAYVSLAAIAANYDRVLGVSAAARRKSGEPQAAALHLPGGGDTNFFWPAQMAVIKADAYGHGHIEVANKLLGLGALMFASGSVQESAVLRRGLKNAPAFAAILSLLGLVNAEDAGLCARHGIIPVLHSFDQLPLLQGLESPLSVALKCNTGMSRLGFNADEIPALRQILASMPKVRPVLAMTHLASADSSRGREEIARQGKIFLRMLEGLRAQWPGLAASMGNSAGSLLAGDIADHIGPHICRPGISLYGGNPFDGTSLEALGQGLQSAMQVSAPILAVRRLKKGDGLGYGHTFVADRDMTIGIVAAGYADFCARSLSNKGVMCVEGLPAPILGRVSMQMTAVSLEELPQDAPRPKEAWLLGGPGPGAVNARDLARLWGTITYEVFCLLGCNTRIYKE